MAVFFASMLITASCTDNQRARSWGGKFTMELKPGKQLINTTWKGEDLWILTKDRPDTVAPATYYFSESSSFGVIEGTITIKEQ